MTWPKWKLEYTVTLFVFAGTFLALAPVSFENTRQAYFISKWNEIYNRTEYMFQVIDAQDKLNGISLIDAAKPYLRLNNENVPRRYRPRYMNGAMVYKGQHYFFANVFFTDNHGIVGIKELEAGDDAAFMMMFDINGILPPNRWGKDIYGINVYADSHIEPFGQGLPMEQLRRDCDKTGSGVYCSYYYKIGGGFTE